MNTSHTFTVEPLGGDLLTIARCIVLDVASFPYPSIPFDMGRRNASPGARVWVARDESQGVLGFLAMVARRDLEIVGLAVSPVERRRGIARALLRAVLAEGPPSPIVLHVSTTNTGAIALYRSEGFVVRRRLVRYYARGAYPGGGDALEMIWTRGGAVG